MAAGLIALVCGAGRGILMWFVYAAAIYVPAGLALFVSGKLMVERSFGLPPPAPPPTAPPRKQYRLTLQFRGDVLADYHAMAALAQQLSAVLGATATVAGHDMAENEKNIFIHTTNPPSSFDRCKPLLAQMEALEGLTAAYRASDTDDYKVLWPLKFQGRFAVA